MSRLFLRFPLLRAFVPRVTAPLLPVSRFRQPVSSLTNTPRHSHSRLFSQFPARLSSSSSSQSSAETTPRADATLSQRLKHLIKSYGWYALGVYAVLSVVDFTVAFAAINVIGAEHVAQVTASVKEAVSAVISSKPPEPGREEVDPVMSAHTKGGNEGLYAMIVLAYTIHKTLFLPVRVGLTAGLTPKLVGWLRSRGWAGGAGTKRAAEEMRERFRNTRQK